MDESLLKSEEKAVLALRALYRKYGYLPFRMSKFEEYELYMRNKDFWSATESLRSTIPTEGFWL